VEKFTVWKKALRLVDDGGEQTFIRTREDNAVMTIVHAGGLTGKIYLTMLSILEGK